ncbi:phosphatidylinositol-4-phosphate 5-kinase related [Anaeramoeba flamelloides]|uniref:Phosphatidylinositol-4-phosphate 5-kinase related n=1 Tax=Anaeramoeba flamelloides TaxID=1746091 RepID=A0AAV8A9N6_9EUKA|nr:phosphatidylinositol-4-phosphate 5-kinase related [Anaeramoeba flamelloides]
MSSIDQQPNENKKNVTLEKTAVIVRKRNKSRSNTNPFNNTSNYKNPKTKKKKIKKKKPKFHTRIISEVEKFPFSTIKGKKIGSFRKSTISSKKKRNLKKTLSRIKIDLVIGGVEKLQNFDFVLSNKISLAFFEQYLYENISYENLAFWKLACIYQETLDPIERYIMAEGMIEKYISQESECQVNIRAKQRKTIISQFQEGNYSRELFLGAKEDIHKLMKTDSFSRFKRTQIYKDLQADWEKIIKGVPPRGPTTQRQKIFLEIYQRQKTQVQELEKMKDTYLKLILDEIKLKKFTKFHEQELFGPIYRILNVNKQFLLDLKQRKKFWNYQSLIGDKFLKLCPKIEKEYIYLAENMDQSIKLLKEFYFVCPEIKAKLEERECEWQDLDDVKATYEFAIDMLTDWKKMLNKLLEATKERHLDRKYLEKLIPKIVKIQRKVEQTIFIQNNFYKESDIRKLNQLDILLITEGKTFFDNSEDYFNRTSTKILLFEKQIAICYKDYNLNKKDKKKKRKEKNYTEDNEESNKNFYIKRFSDINGIWIKPLLTNDQKKKILEIKKTNQSNDVDQEIIEKDCNNNISSNENESCNDEKNYSNGNGNVNGEGSLNGNGNENDNDNTNRNENNLNYENELENENWEFFDENLDLDEVTIEMFSPEFKIKILIENCRNFLLLLEKHFLKSYPNEEDCKQFRKPVRYTIFKYQTLIEYIGNLKYGVPFGNARLKYPNGTIFEGNFNNGVREGKGILIYASGTILKGNWKNNKPHGKCIMDYYEKNKFIGNYINGARSGYGIMSFQDGSVYKGDFQDDEMNGKGVWKYSSGETYLGDIINSSKNGFGVLINSSNEYYVGAWKNDLREGKGKQIYRNGDIFIGIWKNNLKYSGKQISINRLYEGNWKTNLYHGEGRLTYSHNKFYKGKFQNGLRHGQGILIYRKLKYIGNWKNDQPEGDGVLFRYEKEIMDCKGEQTNRIIEKIYSDWHQGKPSSATKRIRNEKLVFKGNYKNGEFDGEAIIFDLYGNSLMGEWKNDQLLTNKKIVLEEQTKNSKNTYRYLPFAQSELVQEFKSGKIKNQPIQNIVENNIFWFEPISDSNLMKTIWY